MAGLKKAEEPYCFAFSKSAIQILAKLNRVPNAKTSPDVSSEKNEIIGTQILIFGIRRYS